MTILIYARRGSLHNTPARLINRISSIHRMQGDCDTGTILESWGYAYDGDGVRTTTSHDTGYGHVYVTRYYFGGYETEETATGSTWKRYYSFGGVSFMRDADGFKYFLSDHLGSVSVVLDEDGEVLEQQRYLPFGQPRELPNYQTIALTDFTYTGQRNLPGTGLMDYKARFYSPSLGRFIQPDTIVPGAANPQNLNRYSYVTNSPLNVIDPSGHKPCRSDYLCKRRAEKLRANSLTPEEIMQLLGFTDGTAFDAWKNASENNTKLALMLQYAKVGDIIRLNWNGNETYHLMIVKYGSLNGPVSLYFIEKRTLLNSEGIASFTSSSGNGMHGAGILRRDKSSGQYIPEDDFGEVKMSPYDLPPGWNREANTPGGVAMPYVPDPVTGAALAIEMIGGIGAGVTATAPAAAPAAPSLAVPVGLVLAGLGLYVTFKAMDIVPIYYPRFPPR